MLLAAFGGFAAASAPVLARGDDPPEPPDAPLAVAVPSAALYPVRVGSHPADELAELRAWCGLVPGVKLTAFRSLSRAMMRGFLRDRTALVFTILLPLLFLALFGSLYKNASTPKLTVLEVGRVSLLSQAGTQQGLGKVLTVTHAP